MDRKEYFKFIFSNFKNRRNPKNKIYLKCRSYRFKRKYHNVLSQKLLTFLTFINLVGRLSFLMGGTGNTSRKYKNWFNTSVFGKGV